MNGITINKIHFSSSNEVKNDHENNVKIRNELTKLLLMSLYKSANRNWIRRKDKYNEMIEPATRTMVVASATPTTPNWLPKNMDAKKKGVKYKVNLKPMSGLPSAPNSELEGLLNDLPNAKAHKI